MSENDFKIFFKMIACEFVLSTEKLLCLLQKTFSPIVRMNIFCYLILLTDLHIVVL